MKIFPCCVCYSISTLALLAFAGLSYAADVDHFTDNGFGKPLSTLQHPSGEHYDGVTYVAYQGPLEDPYVCSYHHETKKWTGPFRAGVSLMGKGQAEGRGRGRGQTDRVDNHGRPALIVDSQGYIHLMFGGHGGPSGAGNPLGRSVGTSGGGAQTHVVSKRPKDISEWESTDNISRFGTYSQLVKTDNGDIYLFYRHGSHASDWVYQKSTDDARTFAPPVSVLKSKAQADDPYCRDAWYAWFTSAGGDTIIGSYNYHPCRSNGHTQERYNGYYMAMDCKDGSWSNAAGEQLTVPVTKEHADQKTLVYDTGTTRAKRAVCRMDELGHPHVTFRHTEGSEMRYFHWLGDQWLGPIDVTGRRQSQDGDMVIDSPDVVRMALKGKDSDAGEVAWWKTVDGGRIWKKDGVLIKRPGNGFAVTAMIRNAHPDARVLANETNGIKGTPYTRVYLLGDNGPVTRPEEETRNLGDLMQY